MCRHKHKHIYMLSQTTLIRFLRYDLYWMANRISGNCLTNGESSRLGNFTSESSVAMIEKTLRHQTTSERLLFSSWFIIRVFPQWAVRALLTPVQMQKGKVESKTCGASAPRDMQRTNINLVNVLDPCYRHCCALKAEIMCVCVDSVGHERKRYTVSKIIITVNMQYSKGPRSPWNCLFAVKSLLFIQRSATWDIDKYTIFASRPDLAWGNEWVILNNCVGAHQQNTGAPPHAPLQMNSGQRWKNSGFTGQSWVCVNEY